MIQAAIANFGAGLQPAGVLNHKGTSVVAVSVQSAGSGAPLTDATVSADGQSLSYDATRKAYVGWIAVTAGKALALSVSQGGARYSVQVPVSPIFPRLRSPGPGFGLSSKSMFDLLDNKGLMVSWEGQLADAQEQFAVTVLDEQGRLAWPQATAFQLVSSSASRQYLLAAGQIDSAISFPVVAAGIVRQIAIPGAAAGSAVMIGNFDQSTVFARRSTDPQVPTTLTSIEFDRSQASIGLQSTLQLSAVGVYGAMAGSRQDVSTQATWSTDTPSILAVSATGQLTGVAPGRANVTVRLGSVAASLAVIVVGPRVQTPPGDAVAQQIDPSHTGRVTLSGDLVLPDAPLWARSFTGALSYPLIAGGTVFALELLDQRDEAGAFGYVHALDGATGADKWAPLAVQGGFSPRA